MAGIYIHVPFCKTRCIYCDFFTQTDLGLRSPYTEAICNELRLRKDYLGNETVKTIYFGGGTPSQLTIDDFVRIFESINSNFSVAANTEITLEANPDDLNKDFIDQLQALPFNRISIGIQSFDDNDLTFLNRRHSSAKAKEVVTLCQNAGFENISIDLMYGLPNQTIELWKKNLENAVSLNIQHISSYHLIYEDGTKLYDLLRKGKIKDVNEELSVELFSLMKTTFENAGFIHYEISNFAKEGFVSKHNSSYWKGDKYLGLGPAAHSYNGESRSWNIASIPLYIKTIEDGTPSFETEILSDSMRYNDYVLTRMRTMWGINSEELEGLFGNKMSDYFTKNIKKHIANGNIKNNNNHFTISEKGLLVSDGIMSDLMYID